MQNKVLIVDFGSQYTQLIARRIRELFIYCEISPFNNIPEDLNQYKAIVLSGSPFSVNQENSPEINLKSILGNIPVIAICYGAQLIAKSLNGKVENSNSREYGRANLSFIEKDCKLFHNIRINNQVWMSHGDTITTLPDGARVIASTNSVTNAAYSIDSLNLYALQFHQFMPPTIVGKDKEIIHDFVHTYKTAVLKPLGGKAGEGILILNLQDPNLNSIIEISTHQGQEPVMIQQFLPEAKYGDKMSSVLDVTYKKPLKNRSFFEGSFLGGSANLEGTLYKRRFSYLFGARYKTNKYLLNSMNTKAEYNPSFYDIQCYLNYKINDNLQINLLSNISRNKFIMIPQNRGRLWYWSKENEQSIWYKSIQIVEKNKVNSWYDVIKNITHKLAGEN